MNKMKELFNNIRQGFRNLFERKKEGAGSESGAQKTKKLEKGTQFYIKKATLCISKAETSWTEKNPPLYPNLASHYLLLAEKTAELSKSQEPEDNNSASHNETDHALKEAKIDLKVVQKCGNDLKGKYTFYTFSSSYSEDTRSTKNLYKNLFSQPNNKQEGTFKRKPTISDDTSNAFRESDVTLLDKMTSFFKKF